MSRFFDIADQMRAKLVTVPALSSVSVVVDRQKSLSVEFAKIAGKLSGLLLIKWLAGPRVGEDGPLVFDNRYSFLIWTKPIIQAGKTTADDIVEAAAKAIDGWNPVEGGHCDYDARVVEVSSPIEDESYLLFQIIIQIRIKIP